MKAFTFTALLGFLGAVVAQLGDDYVFEYHDSEKRDKLLNDIHSLCPNITRIYDIGKSVMGLPLRVIEFSATPGYRPAGIPEFKYVANMHGDETVSTEMVLTQAMRLCRRYLAKDPDWTNYILNTSIHLLPTINPDGFHNTMVELSDVPDDEWCWPDNDSKNAIYNEKRMRHNQNKCDLNRNFPNRFGKENSLQKWCGIQPETQAIMDWSSNHSFVLSANLHGGALVASVPFDDSETGMNVESNSPDDAFYRMAAHTYVAGMKEKSEACGDHFYNGESITNGAAWYSLHGSMQDWVYLNTDCLEITVEMSCCRNPPPSTLAKFWDIHREGIDNYMRLVHTGIRGFVHGNTSTIPIPLSNATIHVVGLEKDIHTTSLGDYYRLLETGEPHTYTMVVSMVGYHSQTFSNLSIPKDSFLTINTTLTPISPTSPLIRTTVIKPIVTLASETQPPSPSTPIKTGSSTGIKETNAPSPVEADPQSVSQSNFTFSHHSNNEMEQLLQYYAANFSHIVRLFSIGESQEGHTMWVVELTKQPISDVAGQQTDFLLRPRVKYVANIHGDEMIGRENLLAFMHYVITAYGKDPQITRLLQTTRLFIAPSLNPDGYAKNTSTSSTDIDLNHNFPHRLCEDKLVYERETNNIMKWIESMAFVYSISFHEGSVGVSYPWDKHSERVCLIQKNKDEKETRTQSAIVPDHDLFDHIAKVYTSNHVSMSSSECPANHTDEVFNMNAAAKTHRGGSMQDWNYWQASCMEISVGLTCKKHLPASELEKAWMDNKKPLVEFLEEAHRGIKGFIYQHDGIKPAPGALISVNGIDHIVKSGHYGEFFRPLLPGEYNITVTFVLGSLSSTVIKSSVAIPELSDGPVILHITLPLPVRTIPVSKMTILFTLTGICVVLGVAFLLRKVKRSRWLANLMLATRYQQVKREDDSEMEEERPEGSQFAMNVI